jgi:hypothetical protein
MVTKGYQKGVYEWVTKGIEGGRERMGDIRREGGGRGRPPDSRRGLP